MILPKGFVRNSNEIYQEVAKYPVLPPEKTHEYWLGMPDCLMATPNKPLLRFTNCSA